VPTLAELGRQSLTLENFFGLSAPAKLPADVVAKIHAACNEILAMPEIKQKMIDLGFTTAPISTAAFNTFVRDQVAVLGPAVKGAGIKL
jgi:tripartite-type tricarboxylate transporter receptor subunit TctC